MGVELCEAKEVVLYRGANKMAVKHEKTPNDKIHSPIPFMAHPFAAPAHTIEAASLPKQSELFVQNQQTYSYFCRRKRCLECRIGNVMLHKINQIP